jgi:peptide/nickel transport system permease protein
MTLPTRQPSDRRPESPWRRSLRAARRDPRTLLGAGIVATVILLAGLAPVLSPYDPNTPDFLATLAAPSRAHWAGTDELGRDVLSRIVWGARASLVVGLISVGGALAVGSLIGLVAGYFGRRVDTLLMRAMDVIFAFPSILLALAITAALGPSLGNAMIAIAVVYVPVFARLARGQVLVIREMTYVEASRALGTDSRTIILQHIAPNILSPLVIQGSLLFASAIITESYLSFLGLGIQPPAPSWGSMLKTAIGYLGQAAWMAWFPGLAIFLAVLGLNILGDGLRDVFDPRQG